jgi:hypothetical protein
VRALYCHSDRSVQNAVLSSLPCGVLSAAGEGGWFEFIETAETWRKEVLGLGGAKLVQPHRPFMLITRLAHLRPKLFSLPPTNIAAVHEANRITAKSVFAKISVAFIEFAASHCDVRVSGECYFVMPHVSADDATGGPPKGFVAPYEGPVLDAVTGQDREMGPEWERLLIHAGTMPCAVLTGNCVERDNVPAVPAGEVFRWELQLEAVERWVGSAVELTAEPLILRFPARCTQGRSDGLKKLRAALAARQDVALQPPGARGSLEWVVHRIEPATSIAAGIVRGLVSDGEGQFQTQLEANVAAALDPQLNDHLEFLGDAVLDYYVSCRVSQSALDADANAVDHTEIGRTVSGCTANVRLAKLVPPNVQRYLEKKFLATSSKKQADVVEAVAGSIYATSRACGRSMDDSMKQVERFAQSIGL